MRSLGFFFFALTVIPGCSCRLPTLTRLDDVVRVPAVVDCGSIWLGQSATVSAAIDNVGRAEVAPVHWSIADDAFVVADAPARLSVGESLVSVRCTPTRAGVVQSALVLEAAGSTLSIVVTMAGVTTPSCSPSDDCHQATFDFARGRCLETPLDDGATCAAADQCLTGGTCQAGRCVGTARSCDDHDACTIDVCQPEVGCVYLPRTCEGDGVCHVGSCDPVAGCTTQLADDGTPCGAVRTCVAAQVCIEGRCVLRRPPDGFICAEESPCNAAGHCRGDVCVQPPEQVMAATWSLDVPELDGGPAEAWSDLLVSADGGVTVSSYFMSVPTLNINRAPVRLSASARRCIAWRDGLVCADFPPGVLAGVSLVDAAGRLRWTYSAVLTDLPYFAQAGVEVFLARLVAVRDDQVAAIYESRLSRPTDPDRCRRFGIVTLDLAGRVVAAAMIEHPLFDRCTHPHSYGVASDTDGNLYFGFSPSDVDNPATAIEGTVLMRYSPQLTRDWVTVEPSLVGGEIAVARGTLLHERASRVWSTETGQAKGDMPVPFGFGVVARDAIFPAPLPNATEAMAIDPVTLAARWVQPLASPAAGGPVHLASMRASYGQRTVLLSFTGDASARRLSALDVPTGAALFSCPIDLPERPAQSALTAGQLTVMSGARPLVEGLPECDQCDPRWARTRNTVRTYLAPQLRPASAPWPGAWGGIGHDHREDPGP
jgi:hypothetical protein